MRQLSISWRRLRSPGNKNSQFVEQLLLGLPFVIRRESFQCCGNQCLCPTVIEKQIFITNAAVSLEKRLCLLSLFFMQRHKNLCATPFQGPFSVDSIRKKIFERREQK